MIYNNTKKSELNYTFLLTHKYQSVGQSHGKTSKLSKEILTQFVTDVYRVYIDKVTHSV